MKRLLLKMLTILSLALSGSGCLMPTVSWMIDGATESIREAARRKDRERRTDALAQEVEHAPSRIVTLPDSDMSYVLPVVLANPDIRFEERDLIALAVRYQRTGYGYNWESTKEILARLYQRPELSATGLRALEPMLLTHENELFGCCRVITAYLANPNVPADILEAYADMPWRTKSGLPMDNECLDGVSRFARRRLNARLQSGDRIERHSLTELERFLDDAFMSVRTIPEALEVDHPSAGWRLDVTPLVGWSGGDADYVYTVPADRQTFAGDGLMVRLETVHVTEPIQSSADWRKAVQAAALTVSFGSAEEREAFLQALLPITSFVSGIPERGLVHRPDARRHFGYSVTPEASAENGRPRLRLARAYREPL